MKHALVISFYYPPDASSSGVLRTLKYTRYLADCGWRVTVLCPEVAAYESHDDALVKQIPDSVRVVRTPFRNTKAHWGWRGRYPAMLALPDVWVGWLPYALAAGKRVGREDPVDVIYSTSPPATAHLVAWRLTHALKRPWVADFRDPWIEDPPEPGSPSGAVFRAVDKWLERRVVERSAHIVTTTRSLRDLLALRYPALPADHLSVIPNGYDEADFPDLPDGFPSRGPCLCILHAGGINPNFRDPAPLLHALRDAADRGLIRLETLRLRFLGGGPYAEDPALRSLVAQLRLEGSVEFIARQPYADALRAMSQADVLLILQASEDTRGLVPAKLYEYLWMRKPILALVLHGEASEVLEQTGGGVAVDPADRERLVAELARLFSRWQHDALDRQGADPALLARYDRRQLARRLAATFEQVSSPHAL